MRIAYFDLISGISGDMTVAALLDLGVPRPRLREELDKLKGIDFRIRVGRKTVNGIRAGRFQVIAGKDQPGRRWSGIRRLIQRSGLSADVRARAIAIFSKLAEAEAKVHGVSPEDVHFHEVGAVDSVVDIVAVAIATCHLDIDAFACSTVPLGRGLTGSLHGVLPVPAPATLELLEGFPVEDAGLEAENVTPTGAAILSALVSRKGEAVPMRIERTGYGAGTLEFPDRPNVLRIVLGEAELGLGHDRMLVMETHIDDMNPEIYDYVMERLFAAGARDVTLSPVQMKKNRPGTLMRILAEPRAPGRARRDRAAGNLDLGGAVLPGGPPRVAARGAEAQDPVRRPHGQGRPRARRRNAGDAGVRRGAEACGVEESSVEGGLRRGDALLHGPRHPWVPLSLWERAGVRVPGGAR